MQQTLIVNGKEFLTASAAGKQFGYTRDYILLLAREKKIVGEKIQNKWYVDPESVAAFCHSAKVQHAERKEQLRIIRQREFQDNISSRTAKVSPWSSRTGSHSIYKIVAVCFVVSSFVVVGYLSLFVLPQKQVALVASAEIAETSFFKRLALLFYDLLTPQTTVSKYTLDSSQENDIVTGVIVDAPVHEASMQSSSGDVPLVAIPEDSFTAPEAKSLVAAFSDEVTVIPDPHDNRTGIVVPKFDDGSSRSYRFFMIKDEGSSRDE